MKTKQIYYIRTSAKHNGFGCIHSITLIYSYAYVLGNRPDKTRIVRGSDYSPAAAHFML